MSSGALIPCPSLENISQIDLTTTPIPDIPTPPFGLVSPNRIPNEQGVYYGALESRKDGQARARPLTSPNLLHAAGHQTPGGK